LPHRDRCEAFAPARRWASCTAPLSPTKVSQFVPYERRFSDQTSVERQQQLAEACARASETIDAARAASDRANLVLRATGQVLARVARALERRAAS